MAGWSVALAVHPFGAGMVYTVGAYLDEHAQQSFMDHVLQMARVRVIKSEKDVG
jgi:hypothetical protein